MASICKDLKGSFSLISQTDICMEDLTEKPQPTGDTPDTDAPDHKPFSIFGNANSHCEQKQPLLLRPSPERKRKKKQKENGDDESTSESECSTQLLENLEVSVPKECDDAKVAAPHPKRPSVCPSGILVTWNWKAIRLICLVAFLSSMSLLACVVTVMFLASSGHCGPPRQWWQGTVMYEVFPASFQDTDGDGFGDLRGLVWRLDYVRSLNVSVLRLNSIFSALDYPLEYEHIIDFSNVDPHLGRMEDLNYFLAQVKSRGMRIVLDINPTVTSDQHTWAAHWLLNRPGQYENYYVNNTDTLDETSYDTDEEEDSERMVPHRTFGSQLFLNWSNPSVQQEFLEVLELWLNKGIDGFYLKHLERMHITDDQELLMILQQWRWTLDRYGNGTSHRILMTSEGFIRIVEKRNPTLVPAYLSIFDLLDVRLNVKLNGTLEVADQVAQVSSWTSFSTSQPNLPWISWHVGGVETSRLASRLHRKYTLGSIFLLMMLPGSVSIFYGDEIGLEDSFDVFSQKVFRSGQLCPMQWSSASQANFTDVDALPWLPVHPAYSVFNAANQAEITNLASRIISLRQSTPSIAGVGLTGGYRFHHADGSVVGLERYYPKSDRYYLAANLGYVTETRDLSEGIYEAEVVVSTNRLSGRVRFHSIRLEPGEAFVALIDS